MWKLPYLSSTHLAAHESMPRPRPIETDSSVKFICGCFGIAATINFLALNLVRSVRLFFLDFELDRLTDTVVLSGV